MRVEDYMSTPVVVVKPEDTLAYARNLMIRYRIGRLVVIDDAERPIGILTRSDMVRALSEYRSRTIDSLRVEEVMTKNPATVKASQPLRQAARVLLEKGVSGLPVVDEDGKLVGIITKTDIVKAYAEKIRGKHRASDFMETEFPTAMPTHSISYVMEQLLSSKVKRVLVVDGNRLVGIIAPSDVAFYEFEGQAGYGVKMWRRIVPLEKGRLGPEIYYGVTIAADVMTPNPVTTSPEEDLAVVASLMLRLGVSSIPVVRDDEPLGIVMKHNILEAIVRG